VALASDRRARNPVITCEEIRDVKANLVADPFMVCEAGVWHLFFELFNVESAKGEIGLAVSNDGLHWRYQQRVLVEPFHLSYPYVFSWAGAFFMIPESRRAGEVRLYRADRFPTDWSLEAVLLRSPDFVDSSVFQFQDRWWLLSENSDLKHDTLRLFHAKDLLGPWVEHPRSPVISNDPCRARPAGRVIANGEGVVRYAQECHPFYGVAVRAFKITELTPRTYREQPVSNQPILKAKGWGWSRCGMHHVDPHRLANGRWLACVDGWYDGNDPNW
jgi:hypothetical protein